MFNESEKFSEFDFFMDEDMRSRRIGILCMEKRLTAVLTQELFRIKEKAHAFHHKRVQADTKMNEGQKRKEMTSVLQQLREIKWSHINFMHSFAAEQFVEQYFHYVEKGPLPLLFFNFPFIHDHAKSIEKFFKKINYLKIHPLQNMQHSKTIFFLDSFTIRPGYNLEEIIQTTNNLSRCYKIDSRANDLMQITDLLLGITTFILENKQTFSSAKIKLVNKFRDLKKAQSCESVFLM